MGKDDCRRNPGNLQHIIDFSSCTLTVRPNASVGCVEIIVTAGEARGTLCLAPSSSYRLADALTMATAALPVPEGCGQ